jgi:hypothetical protein
MDRYSIFPGRRSYWIVVTSGDNAPIPVEQYDDEPTALRRLRVLQERERSMAEPVDGRQLKKAS